jgi:hypothetical protein
MNHLSDSDSLSDRLRYNEKMFETKKFKIYENFMQKNSAIRILCVIDVMRLNMNILDVNIIIQWKKSFNIRTLMQRADRVVKEFDRFDEFIWFHFVWCKKEKVVMSIRDSKLSQFRQVMNINDTSDSKFELNEKKKKNEKKDNNLIKKLKLNSAFLWKTISD